MSAAAYQRTTYEGQPGLLLKGDWTLAHLPRPLAAFERELGRQSVVFWDLSGVSRLDSAGALLLWRIWGRRWPEALTLSPQLRGVLERSLAVPAETAPPPRRERFAALVALGELVFEAGRNLYGIVNLLGQLVLDGFYLLAHPQDIPWREFSANIYRSGAQALPVTALVGFLIGVVLSYLSALQLKTSGADTFIVNLLGISIIRELGPVIVAVLVAGRSGSAMS